MVRLLASAAFVSAFVVGLAPTPPTLRAADPKLAAASGEGAAKDFFFKPNDRIVFLGDSITAQYQYSTYIELYLTTRMPKGNFAFINAGIGGDTANGGANRFQTHVLAEKPTAITINFGMNDGGYGAFNPQTNKVFVEKTAAMLDMANKAGARVALLSPNAVDRRNKSNGKQYVETQKEFYAPLKDLAAKHKVSFVDQYALTRAATDKMEVDDPAAKKAVPYYDGFHTSPPGGMLMAHAILTGLKAPALVSDVSVEVKSSQAAGKGCKVDGLEVTPTSVAFTRTDDALPLPVQKDWLPMLPYTNELKDLNYYGLTVQGLKDGDYTVSIDGTAVGKFSAAELGKGVNLGNVTTGPVWEQSNKVLQAINAKNGIVAQRFYDVVMFQFPNKEWLKDLAETAAERRASELKKRMEKIDAAQAEIYKLAAPVARKFEIKPAQ
ncbi:SGNH/GDSL hydrolase family protein [Gemmata sp. G18]|uniref:SGNH/GDSL hydrolase family protein n=1 Tax=Gemmata palustris TaxID=2822762 RepID=A0ABS5BY05_9BACT|nr:SGNH/GDSL hydrolase family protein [Gemmata palustris]MBP3958622.1 SGNH/GDSL hydrolase family protein [Gemmata palustris]